jgi:copper chaperone NosL
MASMIAVAGARLLSSQELPMPRAARWLVAVASLAVLGVFAFPLWRVTLEAPQYPEGIGMLIHVNGVTGVGEHDLNNINGLNHYIGMARIEPESIPELRYMPWIAVTIAVTGVLVALAGSRRIYIGWASIVIATLAAGVYDFWKWEYSYGHNLSPDAAIRIPGLTYQPPLFGSKQILNFVAHSYPDIGGWMLIAAGVTIGSVLLYLVIVRRDSTSVAVRTSRAVMPAAAASLAVLLTSCQAAEPRALSLGADECAQCRMMITDARFGAEVITRTGRIQTFDAIECAAAYVAAADSGAVQSIWVSDFEHPGTLISAVTATFITSATVGSPMGRSLLALGQVADGAATAAKYGGHVSDWQALVAAARTAAQTSSHVSSRESSYASGARHDAP